VGFDTGVARVPIVPAAALFDLGLGDGRIRPDARAGALAAAAASVGPVEEGSVGAGAGALVGKLLGAERAMRGGLGNASVTRGDGAVVGALAVVNAVGDVVDPDSGRVIAGARGADGRSLDRSSARVCDDWKPERLLRGESTTLVVVATDIALEKSAATMVARMAHAGLARTLDPVHTPWDGDIVFVLSTGRRVMNEGSLVAGVMAAEAVGRAVVRGIRMAEGREGFPASRDLGLS
jgi:L-aminopeptidase/D-esterase-like protein